MVLQISLENYTNLLTRQEKLYCSNNSESLISVEKFKEFEFANGKKYSGESEANIVML